MRIFRDPEQIPFARTVVSVGSYDGVHKGHRLLLGKLKEEAKSRNAEPVVLTFSPHPKKVLGKSDGFLTTPEEQLILLEEAGAENVCVIPFTVGFSNITAEVFVREVLLDKLHAVAAIMGTDHTFGRGGCGRLTLLASLGIEPICVGLLDNIGSTEIRSLVRNGDVETAGMLLGGNGYLISTPVTDATKILPPDGKYEALVDGKATEVTLPGLPDNCVVRIFKSIEK